MSKKVKSLITKELGERFKGIDAVAVISPRGITATMPGATSSRPSSVASTSAPCCGTISISPSEFWNTRPCIERLAA